MPFGEVGVVKDWLKITGDIGKPEKEHPKRLVEGLQCKRKEVSGRRFWEFFKGLCGTPENFTRHCLVYNYCPLSFMTKSGLELHINSVHESMKPFKCNKCNANFKAKAKLNRHISCVHE